MIAGGVGVADVGSKQNWAQVDTRVVAIDVSCEMSATERGILSKTTSTATIACEDVELFKATYPDKSWLTHTKYMGLLQLPDGSTHNLLLGKKDGHEPEVGDTVRVVQNPTDPSELALGFRKDWSNGLLYGGIALGGAFLFALPIITRRRKSVIEDELEYAPAPQPSQRTTQERFRQPPPVQPTYSQPVIQPRQPTRTFGRRNTIP